MIANAFIGKPTRPGDDEVSAELGSAKTLWEQLLTDLALEHEIKTAEWYSYSPKAGWSLRLRREKRTILYLSPGKGCFMVSFALGDRAVQAARQSRLPRRVIRIINEARRYAEGTAVRIDVTKPEDIDVVKQLADLKIQH
jgi:hypothetical protein